VLWYGTRLFNCYFKRVMVFPAHSVFSVTFCYCFYMVILIFLAERITRQSWLKWTGMDLGYYILFLTSAPVPRAPDFIDSFTFLATGVATVRTWFQLFRIARTAHSSSVTDIGYYIRSRLRRAADNVNGRERQEIFLKPILSSTSVQTRSVNISSAKHGKG
jgi:hypothetical protein